MSETLIEEVVYSPVPGYPDYECGSDGSIWSRRRKKDDETSRIARLLQGGRIVEGRVIDVLDDADGNITQVFYNYCVAGVDYESSQ